MIPDLETKYTKDQRDKFDAILALSTPTSKPRQIKIAIDLIKELTNPEATLFTQYKADLAILDEHKQLSTKHSPKGLKK